MNTSYAKCLRRFFPLTTSLLLLFAISFTKTIAAPDGQKIFKQNCAQCHSIGDNKVVGPGLKGVESRWPDKKVLHHWIKNNAEVLKSGDAYANELFTKYNKSVMPAFPSITDEDIDAILAYVNNPPKGAAPKVEATATAGKTADNKDTMLYVLIGLGILFLILIYVLKGVRNSLEILVREKNNLPEPAPAPTGWDGVKHWMYHHKKHVAVIFLILAGWGSKVGWDTLAGIGITQGYMPEQPIFFPHKLHAGDNKINCVYCHSGAERGKVSGVPSANVCMNCHKYIQEGPTTGKDEIAKIYAALGYDPVNQTYSGKTTPIKWIRVHNLPDHVYFNHSQHVVAGKVECQKCHGPIEQMDTVRQFSRLTMEWCINCHRETEVKMEGNDYYKELHAKLKEKYKGEPITVAKMGGLECAKCHY